MPLFYLAVGARIYGPSRLIVVGGCVGAFEKLRWRERRPDEETVDGASLGWMIWGLGVVLGWALD